MASVSPPKPWERAGASGNALPSAPIAGNPVASTAMTSPSAANPATASTTSAPRITLPPQCS
ncbi:hypothetical protein N7528_005678 [Penicillium herquei]|nr:hypothetical protein N7528_005678 [Penicillium herquei]